MNEHGLRVTYELFEGNYWYWADCPCGAETGPFATAEEARAVQLQHRVIQ